MVAIQWYPGHMEKARRQMQENLRVIDLVIEVRDARIPRASANPLLAQMAGQKPRLIILAKSDLADPQATAAWIQAVSDSQNVCLALDLSKDHTARTQVVREALQLCEEKRQKMIRRGIHPRAMRAMVAGIPNVGKSTLINRIAGRQTAKTADKPGVTRSLVWIHADPALDIMDTPGVLWPKFDDPKAGSLLAATGAINDDILPKPAVAADAIQILQQLYPELLVREYACRAVDEPEQVLAAIAAKRHLLKENSQPDLDRAADLFLHELRRGRLGPVTLERP